MVNFNHEEFVCYRFIHNVFAAMAVAEAVVSELSDPKREITTDYYTKLHFERHQAKLRVVLDNASMKASFRRLYPNRTGLLDLAADLVDSMGRLHTVRQALIEPHVNSERTDVHNYKDDLGDHPVDLPKADKAQTIGLTEAQFDDLASQVNATGFLHLGDSEKATLRNAVLAEFNGLS